MNNTWNRGIYKLWAPVYDSIFNSGAFLEARKHVFKDLELTDKNVLFAGVGTGADLELVELSNVAVTAIDFSPVMLQKAKKKFKHTNIEFIEMDAQRMDFEKERFDIVFASLILSVVPDPIQSLNEMERVLKPYGQLVIFDKFASEEKKLSQKVLRPLVKVLGTDIGLVFEDIHKSYSTTLKIEEDVDLMMNGLYRKIVLRKMG
ncbi:class I SAM-dependent methyltransferase [Bacillus sp. Marseille-Q1617]|uniref:class I SAM-dependent methyltransferase n=1 Tax=Bacillus sp. Marseille-Q1617 TaxID=2736887 RepID=UPI00158ED518|nr:class I SAM-dependent methyltransferase [Bacillus sp. Marseille-Q1617]